jgi:LysM repeat protein
MLRRVVSGLLVLLAFAACGDDDVAEPTPTPARSVVTAGVDSTAVASGDAEVAPPAGQNDLPTLDEVGRADFTYTIVAGDFLSRIASRYHAEIDDIAAANQWADGRDHLLLPGAVIYLPANAALPADAALPAGTTALVAPGRTDDGAAGGTVDPSTVCQGGVVADTYQTSQRDTLESVAERLGLPTTELRVANTGLTFVAGVSVWVPCKMNWPRFVAFSVLIDPPVCIDGSIEGTYTVQRAGDSDQIGEGAAEIAARLGITEEQLTTQSPSVPFGDLQAGDVIAVCSSWFER